MHRLHVLRPPRKPYIKTLTYTYICIFPIRHIWFKLINIHLIGTKQKICSHSGTTIGRSAHQKHSAKWPKVFNRRRYIWIFRIFRPTQFTTTEIHPTPVLHLDRPRDNNVESYGHRSNLSSSQFLSSKLQKSTTLSHYTHLLTR